MNHFSYEVMGIEKVKAFRQEGMRSQAVHSAGMPKAGAVQQLSKVVLVALSLLGFLSWLL